MAKTIIKECPICGSKVEFSWDEKIDKTPNYRKYACSKTGEVWWAYDGEFMLHLELRIKCTRCFLKFEGRTQPVKSKRWVINKKERKRTIEDFIKFWNRRATM